MKKLNKEIMTGLYYNEVYDLETVSEKQVQNFEKAKNGDDTVPAYMLKFCTNFKPVATGSMHNLEPKKVRGKKFVLSAAQNNSKVHTKFLSSLKTYCKHNDADLLVGKFLYNKNGFQNGKGADEEIYYDASLEGFLIDELTRLTNDLFFAANLNILPTAKFPLNGFESYQGGNSVIIPTSKIALQSVATMKDDPIKILYGTGCVTLKNYIQMKAGQVGESSHSYGALVVEIDGNGTWFARQIETDESGIFQDLTVIYHPDHVEIGEPITAITFGDFHSEKMDWNELAICKNMVKDLRPSNVFIHDLFDMTTRNHHNKQSGHFLYEQSEIGNTVEKDLIIASTVLNVFKDDDITVNIVESNHDQALEKWLDDPTYNYRTDPTNSKVFLNLQLTKYENILNKDFILLEYALYDTGLLELEDINFLQIDDSFKIAGIEMAVHGHIGMNGSRGNPKQFQKLNIPMNTGHTHTCSIYGDVYTSGVTGSLDMGYNKGASSWSHSHILVYDNGFRTIITTKNNQYCLED